MVRLLVEEACDALPLPNRTQRRRNDRFLISTSNARDPPAQRVRSPAACCGAAARPHSSVEVRICRPFIGIGSILEASGQTMQ
ncbi:MAG: hypothetical protein EOQ30_03000 [Mesorhizobium sp.]|nr:hypothetical protein EJ071_15765 [Mesorhizobium sp. M1B.F.Ca.ET.045.04.1.1]RWA85779.1 MAG: hypothetical protein EOQ30_03000 [Mesorhizobium sp.]RWB17920.1 MAG: hypothetical protein EOQ40_24865 [Mesorhizobium sp.]RWD97922.1 MAG: hypothetical protein EOS40_26195 [Mesorhizobium sp.]